MGVIGVMVAYRIGSFAKTVFSSLHYTDGRSFDKREISLLHFLLGMDRRTAVLIADYISADLEESTVGLAWLAYYLAFR